MKTILLEEWLFLLRNTELEQGHGCLCEDGKYCVLGVAGKALGVLEDNLWVFEEIKSPLLPTHPFISDLPERMWANPTSYAFDIRVMSPSDPWMTVSQLNDHHKMSFPAIADAVESTARSFGWKPKHRS